MRAIDGRAERGEDCSQFEDSYVISVLECGSINVRASKAFSSSAGVICSATMFSAHKRRQICEWRPELLGRLSWIGWNGGQSGVNRAQVDGFFLIAPTQINLQVSEADQLLPQSTALLSPCMFIHHIRVSYTSNICFSQMASLHEPLLEARRRDALCVYTARDSANCSPPVNHRATKLYELEGHRRFLSHERRVDDCNL